MEVLSCSGTHYVGESDVPPQGSGAASAFDKEYTCYENSEPIQATHAKVDDLVPNVKGPREDTDGSQWTVNSEGPYNTYYEFEVDGQKLSSGSRDSEDDEIDNQDLFMGSGMASDNTQIIVNTIESGQMNNLDGGCFLSESKWLEQDEPLAVWVKWRGKWQTGIKCARTDWPLSTLKAKPTHDRKKYLVIFFPRTRNYSWADVLLVRPINEFPQPIGYKTHKAGVKNVQDLTLARRFIMQKLSVSLLNVLDQLHSEALIEAARSVTVWKEFAVEVSRCEDYLDLGRMLLKLQNMFLQSYISSSWLQHSQQSWVQQCRNANSAESVELLKEELVGSVLWNEVNSLLDRAALHDLGSEWKAVKHEVMKLFSISHPMPCIEGLDQPANGSPTTAALQTSRKRPKLEVRRAEAHTSQVESQGSHQDTMVEIDSGFFRDHNVVNSVSLESQPAKNDVTPARVSLTISPLGSADGWGEIVVEAENSKVIQNNNIDVGLTPVNELPTRKFSDSGNKGRKCMAFIEAKGRQCGRSANDGDVYCCVHLASRFTSNSTKAESVQSVTSPMCQGTTVLGTKCKHRALYGSSFCKKHGPRDHKKLTFGSPESNLKRKQEDTVNLETAYYNAIVPSEEVEAPLEVDPISVAGACIARRSIELPQLLGQEKNVMEQCIGLWRLDGSEPCVESPKRHSLYCEKHLPSWLKRARNGKSRIISKEVFIELLKDCRSREQKLYLHRACELFYRLFKSILSLRNPVPKEVQFQWAISEASKDPRVGEFLMKLVSTEKERLKRLWGFSSNEDGQTSSFGEPGLISNPSNACHDSENDIKCNICSEKFSDDKALGAHWMDNHRKEAQWLFRGYVCAICLDSFTNKKMLEAHVQERHHVQFVEQCMLLQCIPCGSHFGNPEQLWSHVLSIHPANFRMSNASDQLNLSVTEHTRKPELGKPSSSEINAENQSGIRRFICRFCGLKFDLLPDLGRHHQAAHMGASSVNTRLPKKGMRYYAYRLKSGRLTRPKFKKAIGSAALRIRNRTAQNLRKRIQSLNSMSAVEVNAQPSVTETASLGRLADYQCSIISKMLFSEIKKTKPRPTNAEILSTARLSCCKISLQTSLVAKYGVLPERISLKAAKLCSEQNVPVSWHQEGFVCPNGCRPIVSELPVCELVPFPKDSPRPIFSNPDVPANSEWTTDESHCVIDSKHFIQESVDRNIILCDDISFGQESVPVACVVDENLLGSLQTNSDSSDGQITERTLPWESFTYIAKSILNKSLCHERESLQLGCACPNSTCSAETCDHVYLFDNDYEDAKDIYGKPMNNRFPYDERGRIIVEEGYLVYECNQRCHCSRTCRNRVLQNGVQVKLEIFKTEKKGWAVRARGIILRGTFVCEYVGEVIGEDEANERRISYGNGGGGYLFEIDARTSDMSRLIEGQRPYVIDATKYGNVSRYVNHSCSPNLVSHQVLVESMDCQLAHIGFYARRDISAGEELTYDYRYKLLPGEGCPCPCGSSNCRGRLY